MTICKGCFAPLPLYDRLIVDKSLPGLSRCPTIESDYCPKCRRACAHCGDWMKNKPEMVVREDEKPMHAECYAEILREMEDNGTIVPDKGWWEPFEKRTA